MSICKSCKETLNNGHCENPRCAEFRSPSESQQAFLAALPTDYDGSQLIDYTQSLGQLSLDDAHNAEWQSLVAETQDSETKLMILEEAYLKEIESDYAASRMSTKQPDVLHTQSWSMSVKKEEEEPKTIEMVIPTRSISIPVDPKQLNDPTKGEFTRLKSPDDEYEVKHLLGKGATGYVYAAEQRSFNRMVAIKVLKERLPGGGGDSDAKSMEMRARRLKFFHEARLTSILEHPSIIPVHDMAMNSEGVQFYSMKLIENSSWMDKIRSLTVEENVDIFNRICDAMRRAHDANIIHRDLKPQNVMLGNYGEVYVVDWGGALDLNEKDQTIQGFGTPPYMAPEMSKHFLAQIKIVRFMKELSHIAPNAPNAAAERARLQKKIETLEQKERELSAQINASSDIYVLGAILFEIALGHPPHFVPSRFCRNLDDKLAKELYLSSTRKCQHWSKISDPRKLTLHQIALRAMDPDPAKRHASVAELQAEIRSFEQLLESYRLTERGAEQLDKAKPLTGYQHILSSLEAFREANRLSEKNPRARRLQVEAACLYADRANRQNDFDAGLSILDEYSLPSEVQSEQKIADLRRRLHAGKKRRQRVRLMAVTGWAAAIILPLLLWGWAAKSVADANVRVADAAQKVTDADKKASSANDRALAADRSAQVADEKAREADKRALAADEAAKNAEQKATDADRRAMAARETARIADEKAAQADVRAQEANALALSADQKASAAAAKEIAALSKVAGLEFNSNVELIKSAASSVPALIGTNQLGQAQRQIEGLIQNKEIEPAVRDGWETFYLQKLARPQGFEIRLATEPRIAFLLPWRDSYLSVTESPDGTRQLTQLGLGETLEESSQEVLEGIALPQFGVLRDASLSPDQRWLTLALDNVSAGEKPIWIFDLQSQTLAATLPDEALLGCGAARLYPQGSSGLELWSVDEYPFDVSTSRRLKLTRRLLGVQDGSLKVLEPGRTDGNDDASALSGPRSPQETPTGTILHEFPSDTRNDSRPHYVAVVTRRGDRFEVAVAADTTAATTGAMLEVYSGSTSDPASGQAFPRELPEIPTAIQVDSAGNVWCGFNNGALKGFAHDTETRSLRPIQTLSEHTAEVVQIAVSANGQRMVSGSSDGVLIAWQPRSDDAASSEWVLQKRLMGHKGPIAAVSLNGDMITGDESGYVRRWNPESPLHDAFIEPLIASQIGVRCGAIDRQRVNSQSFALGAENGDIHLVRPDPNGEKPRFREIQNPYASFDKSFRDFSGLAKIGERLLQLDRDGVLSVWDLRTGTKSPARIAVSEFDRNALRKNGFEPLITVSPDNTYFLTADPASPLSLIGWIADGNSDGGFRRVPVSLDLQVGSTDVRLDRIRQIAFSPDGRFVALVVKDNYNWSRPFVFALPPKDYRAASDELALREDLLGGAAAPYRVENPAFIQFSADSRQLSFHYFTDRRRTTNVDRYRLQNERFVFDDQLVLDQTQEWSIIDWHAGADDLFLVRRNEFVSVLSGQHTDRRPEWTDNRNALLFAREDAQAVALLKNDRLEVVDLSGNVLNAQSPIRFDAAIGLRQVNESEVVVIDSRGLHLVSLSSDPHKVDLRGNRLADDAPPVIEAQVSCIALEMCGPTLVASYSNGETIVFDTEDVDGRDQPTKIGQLTGVQAVSISPDAKWMAAEKDGAINIHRATDAIEQVATYPAAPESTRAFAWLNANSPDRADQFDLLCVDATSEGKLTWQIVDPATGVARDAEAAWSLPTEIADDRLDGPVEILSLELSPQSNEYLALMCGTASADPSNGTKLGIFKVAKRGVDGWIKEVDQALQGRNVVRGSFSEIRLEEATDDATATRLALLIDDRGTRSPALYMLAHRQLPAAIPSGVGATEGSDPAPPPTEFRFEEFQNLLTELRQNELIDLAFSGDGRILLTVGSRATRALLSDAPPPLLGRAE